MGYNFTTQWVKGTLHNAPDALSRKHVSDSLPEELLAEFDNDNHFGVLAGRDKSSDE